MELDEVFVRAEEGGAGDGSREKPAGKNAVVKLMELSADEQTRLLYESRQKMEWDNMARERGASDSRAFAIARNLVKRNRPIGEIIEDTGLTREEIEGLHSAD